LRRGRCQLRDTVSPTFVRLMHQALEGGQRKPRRGDKYFFHVYTGLHRDVRPVGTVFPVAIGPVRPSPPLQHHSGHCSAIPDAVKAHRDRTSLHPLLCLVRPPINSTLELAHGRRPDKQPLRYHPRSHSCMGTRLVMTSQQEQDSPGRSSTPWHYTPCLHM
jgi:hypothetical protein